MTGLLRCYLWWCAVGVASGAPFRMTRHGGTAVEQSASPGQRALCVRSTREFVNKVQARLGTMEGIDEVLEQLAVDAEVLEQLAVDADPDSLPRAAHGSGQCNVGFAGDDDSGDDYGHCGDHSNVSSRVGYDNGCGYSGGYDRGDPNSGGKGNGCDDSGGYDAGGYNSRWGDGGYGNCGDDSAGCDSGGYDDGGANS